VAITRAKALLIVIGDPRVLSLDPLWRGFLNYIYNLRAWRGKPVPDWDTGLSVEDTSYDVQKRRQAQVDQEGLIARIADAVEGEHRVDDLENEGHQEDAVVVERPWREAE
jgi:helicase MOV-10